MGELSYVWASLLWASLLVGEYTSYHLYTAYLPLAIKQPFHENTTGQLGTDSSNSFSGICLDGNWTNDRSVIIFYQEKIFSFFIDLVITSHISLETVWPKLETCVISQCFGCQPLWYLPVCWHEINKRSEAPSFRTNLRRFCPSIIGYFFWNDIPQFIRDKPSKKMFRKALLRWYLAQY